MKEEEEEKLYLPNIIKGDMMRLSHIRRYSSYPVIRNENVAEHTFWVQFYCYLIGKTYDDDVDIGKALEKALLHDLEESVTGDIVITFKHASITMNKMMRDVAAGQIYKSIDRVVGDEKLVNEIFDKWKKAKDDTKEGMLVDFCDRVAAVTYIYGELMTGNQYMLLLLKQAKGHIEKFKNTYLHPYVLQITKFIDDIVTTTTAEENI